MGQAPQFISNREVCYIPVGITTSFRIPIDEVILHRAIKYLDENEDKLDATQVKILRRKLRERMVELGL
jgi:hypothetical protein